MSAPRNTILTGDVRTTLPTIPEGCVDAIITSPPYFQLRDYDHDSQVGLEDSVSAWVDELRVVLRGLHRVLKPTGSLWLNLGDSYSRQHTAGAPPKSLLFGPERVALAMIEDGWTIRNKVVWAKPNPMPSSVGDRLNTTWEVIFHAVKQRDYYFDLDAIREPHKSERTKLTNDSTRIKRTKPAWAGPLAGAKDGLARLRQAGMSGHPLGKNPGDVWTVATSNFRGAHFATYPTDLLTAPILSTVPERTCEVCGRPWTRRHVPRRQLQTIQPTQPTCDCRKGALPGLVLDPFFGSGTTAIAALDHHRDWLGIEVNPDFVDLAEARIQTAHHERQQQAG